MRATARRRHPARGPPGSRRGPRAQPWSRRARARPGSRRTGAGPCGRRSGCCARVLARTPDAQGSRVRVTRSARPRLPCSRAQARSWPCEVLPRLHAGPFPILEQALQHQQTDQRLPVLAAGDRGVDAIQGKLDDLDPLAVRGLARHVVELGGEEEPDALIGEAGARVEALQLAPVARGLADLLGELALGALQGRLALDVELAGWELQ